MNNPKTSQADVRKEIEELLYANVTSFQAVSYEDLTDKILALITKQELAARLDEMLRLKKIDAFNALYSADPRPAHLVNIRIEDLKQQQKEEV